MDTINYLVEQLAWSGVYFLAGCSVGWKIRGNRMKKGSR